jgi:hypothetical protein
MTYKFPDGQTADLTISGSWVDSFKGSYSEPAYDGYFEDWKIELLVVDFDRKQKLLDISEFLQSDILFDILERVEDELNEHI